MTAIALQRDDGMWFAGFRITQRIYRPNVVEPKWREELDCARIFHSLGAMGNAKARLGENVRPVTVWEDEDGNVYECE